LLRLVGNQPLLGRGRSQRALLGCSELTLVAPASFLQPQHLGEDVFLARQEPLNPLLHAGELLLGQLLFGLGDGLLDFALGVL
jgi:hypothetical protein